MDFSRHTGYRLLPWSVKAPVTVAADGAGSAVDADGKSQDMQPRR